MTVAVDEGKRVDTYSGTSGRTTKSYSPLDGGISKEELYSQGMKVLHDFFGVVNAEVFISLVKNDNYDYTQWRRDYYGKMTPEEYFDDVRRFAKTHPYKGNPSTVLKHQ